MAWHEGKPRDQDVVDTLHPYLGCVEWAGHFIQKISRFTSE